MEQILRFESELYKAEKIPATLLAASLIMSNRLIAKDRLKAIWEEIKMLDIIEIAMEKGMEKGKKEGLKKGKKEGKKEGLKEGRLKEARNMVIEVLAERFVAVPADIRNKVYSFEQHDALKDLLRYAIRSSDIDEFKTVLSKVLPVS
ncbi:MAG: hypothetical protein GY799_15940 [Desulfobulbaceae bacterium]|nr:hypothetical protein [Desulfobulbaceae bacterium]